jgi:hypothetical protein
MGKGVSCIESDHVQIAHHIDILDLVLIIELELD